MALSFIEVNPTSGGQTVYDNINLQFVSTNDIFVTIKKADGEVIELAANQYNVTTSPTLTVTITDSAVSDAIATNDTIRIFRDTDVSSPARIFSNGSVLKASDLNANHNQILYAQQENDELGIGDALQKDASGAFWDATSLNIRNVADAVESSDAITLGQVNAALASAGSVPSVPQAYSTASGTLSNGAFANGNTTFSMTPPPTSEFPQTFIVEIDGVIQRPNNDYTVTTGNTEGTLTIIGSDVTSRSIVVTNFGLSRQVFDFPTTGQATTSDETPITLQGHSSQSACIFLVEQSDGDDIFCVKNDHVIVNGYGDPYPLTVKQSTDGKTHIAKFGSHGNESAHVFANPSESPEAGAYYKLTQTTTGNSGGDFMIQLDRSALNDTNSPDRGDIIEVRGMHPTLATGQRLFHMNANGKFRLYPSDDTIGGSEDNSAAIWIQPYNANDEDPFNYILATSKSGKGRMALSGEQVIFGGGGDKNFAINLGNNLNDDGARILQIKTLPSPGSDGISGNNTSNPYWRLKTSGSALNATPNRRGYLGLNAMNNTSTDAAIQVQRGNDSNTTGNFVVRYDGDVELHNPDRPRTANAVLRKDEVAKAAGITLCTHNTGINHSTLVSATWGFTGSSDGNSSGATKTESDTSTYTIASNNSQIAVSQSNGVITVGPGTFLATYSVDAQYGEQGAINTDFELILLKDGVAVARSLVKTEVLNGSETRYISLNYSELVTTTENTTYQLQGKCTLRQSVSAGSVFARIKTRQKSLLIHNLGES